MGGFLKTATGLQIKGLSDDQSGQVITLKRDNLVGQLDLDYQVLKSPEKRARPPSSQAGSIRPLSQNDGMFDDCEDQDDTNQNGMYICIYFEDVQQLATAAPSQGQLPPTPALLPPPPLKSIQSAFFFFTQKCIFGKTNVSGLSPARRREEDQVDQMPVPKKIKVDFHSAFINIYLIFTRPLLIFV